MRHSRGRAAPPTLPPGCPTPSPRQHDHAGIPVLLVDNGTGGRTSLLEQFKPYLHQRWNDGCTNTTQLLQEIQQLGYRGGPTILRKYLHPLRATRPCARPSRKPLSVHRAASRIMADPAGLNPDDHHQLDRILAVSPKLAALAGHVRGFATITGYLRGRDLERWMTALDTEDLPALHSFVRCLRRERDAVTAGLTLPWSSGPVEGHVTLKMIKRQMFGHAKPDLLRKQILLSD